MGDSNNACTSSIKTFSSSGCQPSKQTSSQAVLAPKFSEKPPTSLPHFSLHSAESDTLACNFMFPEKKQGIQGELSSGSGVDWAGIVGNPWELLPQFSGESQSDTTVTEFLGRIDGLAEQVHCTEASKLFWLRLKLTGEAKQLIYNNPFLNKTKSYQQVSDALRDYFSSDVSSEISNNSNNSSTIDEFTQRMDEVEQRLQALEIARREAKPISQSIGADFDRQIKCSGDVVCQWCKIIGHEADKCKKLYSYFHKPSSDSRNCKFNNKQSGSFYQHRDTRSIPSNSSSSFQNFNSQFKRGFCKKRGGQFVPQNTKSISSSFKQFESNDNKEINFNKCKNYNATSQRKNFGNIKFESHNQQQCFPMRNVSRDGRNIRVTFNIKEEPETKFSHTDDFKTASSQKYLNVVKVKPEFKIVSKVKLEKES